MSEWVDIVESKARIIHEQLSVARMLATKHGGDPDEVSKPYLGLLRKLYRDEYAFAQLVDSSDLVARFKGPAVSQHDPSVTIVASVFTDMRNQIRGIAKSIVGLSNAQRLRWPSDLDPHLSGLARGSLVVGINVPPPEEVEVSGQISIPGISEQVYESVCAAVRSLSVVAQYVKADKVSEGIIEEFPDPAVRDTVMVAASRLAPTGRKGIDSVAFFGSGLELGEPAVLTPISRRILKQSLRKPIRVSGTGCFEGVVREIDLDARRFEIRRVQNAGSIRCVYDPSQQDLVRRILDAQISVKGSYESLEDEQLRLVSVGSIKILRSAEEQLNIDLNEK